MKDIIFVGGGSMIGGVARFLLGGLILRLQPDLRFPCSTLTVNLLGCFAIGVLAGLAERGMFNNNLRLFLITGVLGGFTTFSSFGYETLFLMRNDNLNMALANIVLSLVLCLSAVWFGLRLCNI